MVFGICLASGDRTGPVAKFTRTKFIDYITNQFDNNVPPNYDDEYPTIVECEIYVENFDSVNEAAMDFTVTILLHLNWVDGRFSPFMPESNEGYVEIDSKNLEKLWVPDLFFPNEKNAYYHDVLMPNKMLRVYEGGTLSYTTRLSLTLSCPMDLRNYPFDRQTCKVEIESFSYNDGNILLRWSNKTDSPVEVPRNTSLPQFQVKSIQTDEFSKPRRGSGNHSGLVVKFTLSRNIGYYLVQMYIPSILVVMLSWISFWLNVNAVPGRISLGVLTVLTMTTQSSGVNASLPRVSYTKAIDIWMSMCLLFVFLALIEFAIANVLTRKDTNKGFRFKSLFSIPGANSSKSQTIVTKKDDDSPAVETVKDGGESGLVRPKKKKTSQGVLWSMYCDVGSRIAFPVLFVLFNIVYWSYFMMQLEE